MTSIILDNFTFDNFFIEELFQIVFDDLFIIDN